MSEQFYHEVLDYRDLSNGLTHHFFPSEGEAKAWIDSFVPVVHHKLVYIHRAWGHEALAAARIERHSATTEREFRVAVRGMIHVTKELEIQATDEAAAKLKAKQWMSRNAQAYELWDLSAVEDWQVEYVDEA